jgi:hypothetical protein
MSGVITDGWFYVNLAYSVTATVLVGYTAWLTIRTSRARAAGRYP